jgi:hypothetical protein
MYRVRMESSRRSNTYQEIAMLLTELRRFAAWLTQSRAKTSSSSGTSASDASSSLEFDPDPMWHGDHWQNLLSSPMDARRYVMEDWSVSTSIDWNDVDGAAPAH